MKTAVALFCLAGAAVSTMWCAEPPRVGDRAPEFRLPSVGGGMAGLAEAVAKGPVVLVVLRGYPGYQCPFCNRQVQDYLRRSPEFAQMGARVVMVYPGLGMNLDQRAAEFLAGRTLPPNFSLLLDADYRFTRLYGLRWDAPKETAYPATFLIDGTGVVRYAKVVKEHGGRTTAGELLEELGRQRSMQAGGNGR